MDEAIRAAIERLETASAKYRKEAQALIEKAEHLERKAQCLRVESPQIQETGPQAPKIDDWSGVDRATAMHQYMRNFGKGKKIKVADIVAALTQGGCNVGGKFRPEQTSYQKEAERNLFITASRNEDIYGRDKSKNSREIWRI